MGGDGAPNEILRASLNFALDHPRQEIILVGHSDRIKDFFKERMCPKNIKIKHSSQLITMDDTPVSSVIEKKNSSINIAMGLLMSGEGSAFLSAGNTGAIVAAVKLSRELQSASTRTALAIDLTAKNGRNIIMLDIGANIAAKTEHLVDNALLGEDFYRNIYRTKSPEVALLNIGTEETKGTREIKEAAEILKSKINFKGYIEPDTLFTEPCADVIITDGFTGNILLKTIEGLMAASGTSTELPEKLDYRQQGAALLLGADAVITIAHGKSDAKTFNKAIEKTLFYNSKFLVNFTA